MSSERALGTFHVRAGTAEVAAFARETDAPHGRLPFTFPVRWLAQPQFQAAAIEMIGNADWVPIHESQSFDYRAPLALETDYEMRVTMNREAEPSRIVVAAQVVAADGTPRLSMEMILRIVPLPAGEAA